MKVGAVCDRTTKLKIVDTLLNRKPAISYEIVHIIAACCHTEGTAFKYQSKKSLRKAGMSKLVALGFCLLWLMFQSIDGTRADLRNTNDGVPALKGEFPHQVSLRFMQDDGLLHFCR